MYQEGLNLKFNCFILTSVGVKPPPGTYTAWNIKRLEPKSMREAENNQAQNVRNMISAANLNTEGMFYCLTDYRNLNV